MKLTQDSLNQGQLPKWGEIQAARLSKLPTFQPGGWTGPGMSRVYRGLYRALRMAGYPAGIASERVATDIMSMARLIAAAN